MEPDLDPEAIPKSGTMETCNTCFEAKSKKTPYPHKTSRAIEILELIHTDLSGKFSISSVSGYDDYISFIDDYSRAAFIYFW
jgi:hypothetical protein